MNRVSFRSACGQLLWMTGLLWFVVHPLKAQNMDSLSYSLGILVGGNLLEQGFDRIDAASLAQGIADVVTGKAQLEPSEANRIVQEWMEEKEKSRHAEMIAQAEVFFKKNAGKPGVISLPSGLQYEVLRSGDGPSPKLTDQVTTHYHGTLLDGTIFDSSVQRGEPATFPVNGVISGWTEALQLMKVGDKWRLFLPSDLAYGARGAGAQIGPFTPLIFEVELLAIQP